jgi:DNA-binding transcriptional LysR family regulator
MALLRHAGLLRPFLAVARHGNLSAAARELAVSQPALTKSVRKLEQQFGVPLFERRARGMALTPRGAALYDHARQIEAQCRVADDAIDAMASGQAGRVRIGAGPYWGNTAVPRAIARLQQQLPRLDVELEVGVNSVILPKLFAGDLDFVMCALPDGGALPAGIERRDFLEIRLRIVAATQHPLHARRRVTAADLARYPWVLYQHDRDVMNQLAAVVQRGGAPAPAIRVETTSLLAVLQLLRSGPYLACVADALLRALPEPDIAELRFARDIWSFPSGALFHASLREFTPIRLLIDALTDEVKRPARSARASRHHRRR